MKPRITIVVLVLLIGSHVALAEDPAFFPKLRTVCIPRGTAQLLKPYLPKPTSGSADYRLSVETPDYVQYVTFEKRMGSPPSEVKVEPGAMRDGVKYTRHTLLYDVYPGTGFELSMCWLSPEKITVAYMPGIRAGGTFDWRRFRRTITPPAGAAYVRPLIIKWAKRGITGTFWVDNIALREEGSDTNLIKAGTFDEPVWKSGLLKPEGKGGGLCAKFVCSKERVDKQQALWIDADQKNIPVDPNKTYVLELDLKAENLGSPSEKPMATLLFRVDENAPKGKATIYTSLSTAGAEAGEPQATEVVVLPPLKNVRPKRARIAPCMYGTTYGEPAVYQAIAENTWRSGMTWTYGKVNNNVVSILWPRGHRVWLAKPGHPWGAHGKAREFLDAHKDATAVGYNGKPKAHTFCPTWLLSTDGAEPRRMMDDELVELVNRDGYTAVNWDIEQGVLDPPERGFCFCERCLAAFRKEAGLPADEKLDGPAISDKHRDAWVMFRCRQNAELVKHCRAALQRCERPIEFSVYSGYQCKRTRERYGVDWALLGPHLDLAIAGYGCPRSNIQDTIKALNGVPFIGGEMYYLSPTNDSRPPPRPEIWRNRLLRQFVESGCNGCLIWYLPTMDGGAFYHTSEATAIIAAYEEFFQGSTRCEASFAVEGLDPPHWVALEKGKTRMLMLLNFKDETKDVTVQQTMSAGEWTTTLHGQPGALSIDPKKFSHTLEPWGTAIFLFRGAD